MSESVSAHRPSTRQPVSLPSASRAATSTSSQVPAGVLAFQDGTTSVAPKPGATSGEVQAAYSNRPAASAGRCGSS